MRVFKKQLACLLIAKHEIAELQVARQHQRILALSLPEDGLRRRRGCLQIRWALRHVIKCVVLTWEPAYECGSAIF